MASIVVPGLDLAPSVPSRIVTVDVIDMTEGLPAAGAKIDFILPQDLHARSDGKVLKAGTTTLELDANGHGEIRVPAYSDATRPDDWVILVKKSWAPHAYPIRVPAGATKISLASLEPPVEVNDQMAQYLLTDASATIAEGAQWGVNVQTQGNIANFAFTAPPGGSPGQFALLNASSDINQLSDGQYRVPSSTVAEALALPPLTIGGILTQATTGSIVVQDWVTGAIPGQERRYRRRRNPAWNDWVETTPLRPQDIVISENPFEPLTDGQLLLIPNPHAASTAWENGIAGFTSNNPTLWTMGQTAVLSPSGGRRYLTWDRFNESLNVRAQTRGVIGYSTESIGVGLTLRSANHDNQLAIGVQTVGDQRRLIVRQYRDGSFETLGLSAANYDLSTPVNVKAEAVGSIIRAKAWTENASEPVDWMVTAVDPEPRAGAVGLFSTAGAYQAWAGLSVERLGDIQ